MVSENSSQNLISSEEAMLEVVTGDVAGKGTVTWLERHTNHGAKTLNMQGSALAWILRVLGRVLVMY